MATRMFVFTTEDGRGEVKSSLDNLSSVFQKGSEERESAVELFPNRRASFVLKWLR